MGKIIFVIGATRSGKSAFAVETAKKIDAGRVVFAATCVPEDSQMRVRVAFHRKARPSAWKTVEAGADLLTALKKLSLGFKVVIIDCLTLFVSRLLMEGLEEKMIINKVRKLALFASKTPRTTIIVSNEVGAGIVPANDLARRFRDLAGTANQIVAKEADEVYLVVAGIPVKIQSGCNLIGSLHNSIRLKKREIRGWKN